MDRYAINIADLTKPENRPLGLIIGQVRGVVVEINKRRMDAVAITLCCEDERARALIDIIRIRRKKHELRCYEHKGSRWVHI